MLQFKNSNNTLKVMNVSVTVRQITKWAGS